MPDASYFARTISILPALVRLAVLALGSKSTELLNLGVNTTFPPDSTNKAAPASPRLLPIVFAHKKFPLLSYLAKKISRPPALVLLTIFVPGSKSTVLVKPPVTNKFPFASNPKSLTPSFPGPPKVNTETKSPDALYFATNASIDVTELPAAYLLAVPTPGSKSNGAVVEEPKAPPKIILPLLSVRTQIPLFEVPATLPIAFAQI